MSAAPVPRGLASSCRTPERKAWLDRLPDLVRTLEARWALVAGQPCEEASCAWVAPAERADGSVAVLKIAMPHMEGEHEIAGLRFWNGDPTVRVLDADEKAGAMLLERCVPGTILRTLAEPEQDVVVAGLLGRLWRRPPPPHSFRPLSEMIAYWSSETLRDRDQWSDPGLVGAGLDLFRELARADGVRDVLLATDLHAGNILRSEREPWLVIDPKPFVGDPAYDVTQHLFNCRKRMLSDADRTISRIADLCGLDRRRVGLWMFSRAAAEPRRRWTDESMALARLIAP